MDTHCTYYNLNNPLHGYGAGYGHNQVAAMALDLLSYIGVLALSTHRIAGVVSVIYSRSVKRA